MQLAILCGETRIDLSVKPGDAGSTVQLGERSLSLAADWRSGQPFWRGSIDGAAVRFKISTVDEIITLSRRGQRTSLRVLTPRQADLFDRLNASGNAHGTGQLVSPLLGVFVRWMVVEGDRFSAGDPLCVLEAMKMEMVLRAERDGVVTHLDASPGNSIEADAVLMRFA
jgi:propionyl-CoA carboxylase alpha chain